MALSRVTTWVKQQLSFQKLNAEFDNIISNALTLISPLTGSLDCNGQTIILDADADSSLSAGTDDTVVIALGGATVYTLTATIFDFNATRLDLDADNDTSIRADTDDVITFEIAGVDSIFMTATVFQLSAHEFIMDADGDSSLTVDTDDVLHLQLQGFDAFIFDGDVASPVNGLTFTSTATGVTPSITGQGEAGVGINLIPGGTGAIEIDGGVLAGKCYNNSAAINFTPSNGAAQSQTMTVTGCALGDFCLVSYSVSTDLTDKILFDAQVTATNTVTITCYNGTAGGIDVTPTFYVRVLSRT